MILITIEKSKTPNLTEQFEPFKKDKIGICFKWAEFWDLQCRSVVISVNNKVNFHSGNMISHIKKFCTVLG